MTYTQYFKNSDTLQAGDFRASLYRGGSTRFEGECTHPMLFVLQGEVKMRFHNTSTTVKEGNFLIIDRASLREAESTPDTVVLKYTPPTKLSRFFVSCCSAFNQTCTTPAPILQPLWDWIQTLIGEIAAGQPMDTDTCCTHRRNLAKVIIQYPRSLLGEIYVPFYACSRMSCEECRKTPNPLANFVEEDNLKTESI